MEVTVGHYASEMDPEWSERIERNNRQNALRKELADVPIGAFTCDEMKPLMKMLGVYRGIVGQDPTHEEMDTLEARLKKIQAEPQ